MRAFARKYPFDLLLHAEGVLNGGKQMSLATKTPVEFVELAPQAVDAGVGRPT